MSQKNETIKVLNERVNQKERERHEIALELDSTVNARDEAIRALENVRVSLAKVETEHAPCSSKISELTVALTKLEAAHQPCTERYAALKDKLNHIQSLHKADIARITAELKTEISLLSQNLKTATRDKERAETQVLLLLECACFSSI